MLDFEGKVIDVKVRSLEFPADKLPKAILVSFENLLGDTARTGHAFFYFTPVSSEVACLHIGLDRCHVPIWGKPETFKNTFGEEGFKRLNALESGPIDLQLDLPGGTHVMGLSIAPEAEAFVRFIHDRLEGNGKSGPESEGRKNLPT